MAVLVPLLALAAACGSSDDKGTSSTKDLGAVTVVSQQFTEADLLTELYAALLKQAGFDVSIKKLGDRSVYLDKLIAGSEVQISADYLASMANALNVKANGEGSPDIATSDPAATLVAFNKVAAKYGLTALKPAEAQDANAFAVTKKFADAHHLKTLSDLGASGIKVNVSGASACPDRNDCLKGLKSVYGIKVGTFTPSGFGGDQVKADLKNNTSQLGEFGSSDPTVEKAGLVFLTDDKNIRSADNLVPVVNTAWLKAHPEARTALDPLSSVLTTADLSQLIAAVDLGRELPADVAKQYLTDKGLLK
jgi:osmoprotectant transport system substrate-binding protein